MICKANNKGSKAVPI